MANETVLPVRNLTEEEYYDEIYKWYCADPRIYCLPLDPQRRSWDIATEIIFSSILVLIGVIGNGLSIAVLVKDKKSSSTNSILKALAVWDIVFLLATIVKNSLRIYAEFFVEEPFYQENGKLIATVNSKYIYPLYNTARFASFAVTLLVAIDRYVAVCRPMVIRSTRVVHISIAVISVVSAAVHIPTAFEYETKTYAAITRETFLDQSKYLKIYRIRTREQLWSQGGYLIGYKLIFETLVRDLLTMFLLVLFNYRLYRGLKAARQRYLRMRRTSRKQEARKHVSSGESLTRTIVIIVASFTLLNTPVVIGQVLQVSREISLVYYDRDIEFMTSDSGGYKKYYIALVHALSLISTSMNFIFYIVFAKKFKRIFVATFLRCSFMRRRSAETHGVSNTSEDHSVRRIQQQPNMADSDLSLAAEAAVNGSFIRRPPADTGQSHDAKQSHDANQSAT